MRACLFKARRPIRQPGEEYRGKGQGQGDHALQDEWGYGCKACRTGLPGYPNRDRWLEMRKFPRTGGMARPRGHKYPHPNIRRGDPQLKGTTAQNPCLGML